ncbi:MAG: hypothetical protein QXL94_04515 [Candidatus Parvarchaeum sp.]
MSDKDSEGLKNKKREIAADINNYQRLLKSLIALYKFTKNEGGEFYFGGRINPEDKNSPTPDIIIKLPKLAIVGDAKRSLPNPNNHEIFASDEDYLKKFIENDLIKQLKSYDVDISNIGIKNHDLILLAPQGCADAMAILKFDFLDKQKNVFERKFILLVYVVEPLANTEQIRLSYEWGALSSSEIEDKIKRGKISYYRGELDKEMGMFKIFEENNGATPIVYVMQLLWTQIFPEIIKKSDKDTILEWYEKGENAFEVKLSKLIKYLTKLYLLPYIVDSNGSTERIQFKIQLISAAMENFVKMGLVERDNGDVTENTKYKVIWKELPEKEITSYFIEKMWKSGVFEGEEVGQKKLE